MPVGLSLAALKLPRATNIFIYPIGVLRIFQDFIHISDLPYVFWRLLPSLSGPLLPFTTETDSAASGWQSDSGLRRATSLVSVLWH